MDPRSLKLVKNCLHLYSLKWFRRIAKLGCSFKQGRELRKRDIKSVEGDEVRRFDEIGRERVEEGLQVGGCVVCEYVNLLGTLVVGLVEEEFVINYRVYTYIDCIHYLE